MIKKSCLFFSLVLVVLAGVSFKNDIQETPYQAYYRQELQEFVDVQKNLLEKIKTSDLKKTEQVETIKNEINHTRIQLKHLDFWLRYLEPISYKKINGPLPVEWETEVFEKFEKPYKREGAGLTIAYLYLEEENINKDSLIHLIKSSLTSSTVYYQDSIADNLKTHDHFFLCNRLFLLNLAAIYTTGFECPDTEKIIPELQNMLLSVETLYKQYNQSFTETPLTDEYMKRYKLLLQFVNTQSKDFETFDHYTFIKDFINPLFATNQQLINQYKVKSKSNLDYSLNKNVTTIFSKALYYGQNAKGIYSRVYDQKILNEIEAVGKLLFYDPILSGNNLRSCASCHKPNEFYTDTLNATALHFDGKTQLPRNTPTLLNVNYNHLLMLDGKHISLQHQTKDVMSNANEMASIENEMMEKILSCNDYKKTFTQLLKFTPQEQNITVEHISSAITFYYSKFSKAYSPFDLAMNQQHELNASAKIGFNLFMSKAQCATCHFVPQFNGVKPPYVGSEFEVLGVPKDTSYKFLSADLGRHQINPAKETHRAFRTGSIRNAEKTKPYMHNGVFTNLDQVLEFYNGGGGAGRGLDVSNQTLSSDSLKLTVDDKKHIIAFIASLNENIEAENAPLSLPRSKNKKLNNRKVGGDY